MHRAFFFIFYLFFTFYILAPVNMIFIWHDICNYILKHYYYGRKGFKQRRNRGLD